MSKRSRVKVNQTADGQTEELINLKAQLARSLADYDNLRKRVEREQESIVRLASSVLITKLLPVIDMFESAQKHLGDGGLAIAIGEFKNVLKEEGIVQIEVKQDEEFNEEICEAVESIDAEGEKAGLIAEMVLPGWKFEDGKVIRHAKVKVYRKN